MNDTTIKRFLDSKVRVYETKPDGRIFRWLGELIDYDSETITLIDIKVGAMTVKRSAIYQIIQIAEARK